MKIIFCQIWRQHDLEARLKNSELYSIDFRKIVNAIFDGPAANADDFPSVTRHALEHDTSTTRPRKHNDIVEVLSVSRTVGTRQQVVAALCERSDGETLTVGLKHLGPEVWGSQPGSRLTRYRFTGDAESRPGQEVHCTEPAPDFTEQITDALYFQENAYRQSTVKEAHRKTFQWVLHDSPDWNTSPFQTWLTSGSHAFWIEGKAGSGKSTLMKHLHQQPSFASHLESWAAGKQLVIATFFFWHAGTSLQKSHEGVLRSVLYQVIVQRPALASVIFPHVSRSLLRGENSLSGNSITLHGLQEAITLLKKNMPDDLAMFLMIDGVDEYSGDHFDFSRFLTQICEQPSIKLLVSSRPIPACVQEFSRFPRLRLQDLTSRDISAYIDAELISYHLLKDMDLEEPGFSSLVREALLQKAAGVFLWIILVIKRLLIGLGNYDEKESLLAVIDELPSDLEDLYDHMFGKMSKEYQQEASLFFQLTSRALAGQRSSFTALQLHAANQRITGKDSASAYIPLDVAERARLVKRVEGKLRSRCCGLLEICYRDRNGEVLEPSVDFLHRTVFDYLRIPTVWQQITELYKLSESQIDEILLASLVATLPYEPKGYSGSPTLKEKIKGMFAACLLYCCRSDSQFDAQYTQLLEKADAALRELDQQDDSRSPFALYQGSWESGKGQFGLKRPESQFVLKMSTQQLFSLLSLSRMQLPTYLLHKLYRHEVDKSSKSTMLVHSLFLCDLRSSTYDIYLQMIKILLQNGADPNFSSMLFDSSQSIRLPHKRVPSTQFVSGPTTSIQYWMSVWNDSPRYIEIMSLLVDAGACLSEDKGISRASLLSFRDTLKSYRGKWPDNKDIEKADNVLVAIQRQLSVSDGMQTSSLWTFLSSGLQGSLQASRKSGT